VDLFANHGTEERSLHAGASDIECTLAQQSGRRRSISFGLRERKWGRRMTRFQVVQEIGLRLPRIVLRDEHGRRPVNGDAENVQTDPQWRDRLLFYEDFHGDDGAGAGASPRTGWTGLAARLIRGHACPRHEGLFAPGSFPAATLDGTRDERAQCTVLK